ncbi:unnamed protein product [Trichogramma brassicae]|uniref:Ig-like domain-containing protein n=1 Tax=Trichogramma brassicae TaxID=86971 RepID=A0A6H5J4H7_9HYME|nr:unnamed protein product [Trichogramma brassicae]
MSGDAPGASHHRGQSGPARQPPQPSPPTAGAGDIFVLVHRHFSPRIVPSPSSIRRKRSSARSPPRSRSAVSSCRASRARCISSRARPKPRTASSTGARASSAASAASRSTGCASSTRAITRVIWCRWIARSEISATKRFTLAKPPLKPYLQFNYGMDTYDKTVYEIGESILISCTVEEAVPTANVSLYLGQMIFEEITVINASRALTYDDNEKFVSCVVDHVALNKTYETKRQITVLEPQTAKMNVELELGESVSVDEGQTQTILCKMDIPLRLCRFMIPGEGSLVLDPDEESVADGPEYFGAGFDKGECGVKLSPVKSQHAGDITCFLLPKISKARKEESRTIHLVVNSLSKDASSSSSSSSSSTSR